MAKGFKGPKMNNPMGMMGQLQKLQEQLKVAQDQLAEESVPYSAGGGAVKVVMLAFGAKLTGVPPVCTQ